MFVPRGLVPFYLRHRRRRVLSSFHWSHRQFSCLSACPAQQDSQFPCANTYRHMPTFVTPVDDYTCRHVPTPVILIIWTFFMWKLGCAGMYHHMYHHMKGCRHLGRGGQFMQFVRWSPGVLQYTPGNLFAYLGRKRIPCGKYNVCLLMFM